MDIKSIFGEISGKDVININDKVSITYKKDSKTETIEGILIEASLEKIKINGEKPLREINVRDIIDIKKVK